MKRTAPGLLVLLLVLSACAAQGGTSGSPGASASDSPPPSSGGTDGGIAHPTGSEPILVVEEAGGFAMVQMIATRLPTFAMYGDGRVIMQGPMTLEFPGPAVLPLLERTLTEEGIQAVLEAVEETNLFTSDRELRGAQAFVADATDTVFRLSADDRDVTVSVYGLGMLDPAMGNTDGIDPAEMEAHTVLSQLRDALMMIDTTVPADGWEAEGWQPFEADAFRLYVRDASGDPVDGEMAEQVREWPTDDDPAAFGEEEEGFGDGTRCGVVEGDLAATWLEELAAATQMTMWTTNGQDRFAVSARPLLPHDERTCPELFGA